MVRQCTTCRYWKPCDNGAKCCGQCRADVPYIEVDLDTDTNELMHTGVWPHTEPDDWWGRWRERYVGGEGGA